MSHESPHKIELPILAELVNRGDGTFVLKPVKIPEDEFGPWVTVKQAAKLLSGDPKPSSIYALLGEYLVYRRPLKSKVEVSLKSVLALRRACDDPDFWENPISQDRVKKIVLQGMRKLLESSLQEG
jgi:hypothetical protein